VTSAKAVEDADDVVVMSAGGQIMRCPVADIAEVGRNTMGVTVMEVDEDDAVVSTTVVPTPDPE
jgi:DNA gyrase subunit A